MRQKKKKKEFWFLGIGLWIGFVLFNSFVSSIHTSEIASFGTSIGILNGQVPYRDFLLPGLPLYHLLMSLFLLVSKTYQMYILVHSFFAVIAFYIITKITKKGHSLFFAFLLLARPSPFLFIACLLLAIIRMELERKKYYQIRYDYWIGALTAIVMLTNVWLGILLTIVLFQTNRNKKNRFLGWMIPIICWINSMLLTNSFSFFISQIGLLLPNLTVNLYSVFGIPLLLALGIERYRMRTLPNNKRILSIAMIMTLSVLITPSATTLFLSLLLALLYFLLAYREEEYGFFASVGGYMYLSALGCFAIIVMVTNSYTVSSNLKGFQNTVLKKEEEESLIAVQETWKNAENTFMYSPSYPFWKEQETATNLYDLYDILLYYQDDFQTELNARCETSSCVFVISQDAPHLQVIENLQQSLIQSGYNQTTLFSFSIYETSEKDFS